ncbi:MAG: 2-C-methyl-D-erythritol 2,4-cyclodiphosphate synthase [Deltaproteobacteria bacterium]|nr:2-C-methyl-D-erythritol 2,4-cyclodiphosphate synthase [Deltaproteobacteria bacterium]
MKIGFGYDIHRLVPGRPLRLGAVEVPFDKGLEGHSDGDVLLHAIGDALLGASNLGDLGKYFPSGDPQYQGISSGILLAEIRAMLALKQWEIVNIDSTVVAEQPRLQSWIPAMKEKIAQILGIEGSQVSVKAKTNEGMGVVGQGDAMAAFAVALLDKK